MWCAWRTATAAHEIGSRVWLGLGSNEGDRRRQLAAALRSIAELGRIETVSSVYETEPVGLKEQADFWNLVVRLRTSFQPGELLDAIKTIESALGRRDGVRWGPRPIDIDILLYSDRAVSDDRLEIPHPRMMERGFVLAPLVEVDPEIVHPVSHERVADTLRTGSFERIRRLFPGTELMRAVEP